MPLNVELGVNKLPDVEPMLELGVKFWLEFELRSMGDIRRTFELMLREFGGIIS